MSDTNDYPLASVLRGEFDEGPWYGYVVGTSDLLLVLHDVSDAYALDGYRVFRQADITHREESFKKRSLVESALRLKGQTPKSPGHLDLSSIRALMESARQQYQALVINREGIRRGEAEVGTVRMTSEESYVLRRLSVTGTWENDDRSFRYRDVTMVQFGGEYEQTLVLVAGARENGV